jgi:hypothetical protein
MELERSLVDPSDQLQDELTQGKGLCGSGVLALR